MNLFNHYYYFTGVIPHKICDDIVRYGKTLSDQMALTGVHVAHPKKLNKKQVKDLKQKRDSNIVWMNDRWIYKEIQPYVHQANVNAGWNFQWDFSESCQFTKYEKGQFYDWHCDGWDRPYMREGNDPSNGKIRKLSVTVTLSDPKEYSGGELEFDFRNMDPDKKPNIKKCKEILPKGSLVVFPGFVWHRVCPVKKGTRHSLVIWNLGWPYK